VDMTSDLDIVFDAITHTYNGLVL